MKNVKNGKLTIQMHGIPFKLKKLLRDDFNYFIGVYILHDYSTYRRSNE